MLRTQTSPHESKLIAAVVVAGAILVLELVGGIFSNSLALLSDAGHMLVDIFAISLSVFAARVGRRPHTPSLSYGYHRAEILSTFINGMVLAGVSLYIFLEAYRRILTPQEIHVPLLLLIATTGLGGNLLMILLLKGASRESLNVRGAFLHVWGDTLSSVGVIMGGVIVLFTSFVPVDSIIGAIIGAVILRSASHLIKESAMVLMERVPAGFDLKRVTDEIMRYRGVKGLHDLHIWTLTSGLHVLSGHIVVEDQTISKATELVKDIDRVLKEKFGIGHVTLQLECESMSLLKVKSSKDEPEGS